MVYIICNKNGENTFVLLFRSKKPSRKTKRIIVTDAKNVATGSFITVGMIVCLSSKLQTI